MCGKCTLNNRTKPQKTENKAAAPGFGDLRIEFVYAIQDDGLLMIDLEKNSK